MKSLDFGRYLLSICTAAAMLAGCGESQPSGTTQGGLYSKVARAGDKTTARLSWVSQIGYVQVGESGTVRAICPHPSTEVVTGGGYSILAPIGSSWSVLADVPYRSLGSTGPEDAWSITVGVTGGMQGSKATLTVYAGCMPKT